MALDSDLDGGCKYAWSPSATPPRPHHNYWDSTKLKSSRDGFCLCRRFTLLYAQVFIHCIFNGFLIKSLVLWLHFPSGGKWCHHCRIAAPVSWTMGRSCSQSYIFTLCQWAQTRKDYCYSLKFRQRHVAWWQWKLDFSLIAKHITSILFQMGNRIVKVDVLKSHCSFSLFSRQNLVYFPKYFFKVTFSQAGSC